MSQRKMQLLNVFHSVGAKLILQLLELAPVDLTCLLFDGVRFVDRIRVTIHHDLGNGTCEDLRVVLRIFGLRHACAPDVANELRVTMTSITPDFKQLFHDWFLSQSE